VTLVIGTVFILEHMEYKSLEQIYKEHYDGRVVSIDSRQIKGGELFIAIKGENFDGNKYAKTALEAGADYAIVDDQDIVLSEKDERLILVEDGLKMLQDLAHHHRSQLDIPVLGITGSNGKTTTKELLTSVLSQKYSISGTKGNFNNHIGLPLTLLAASRETEILIVEMGTNQPGDIEMLCDIADPTHGIITNIGDAHLEKLISRAGVLQEKGALYRHVVKQEQGCFFRYTGDEHLMTLADVIDKTHSFGPDTDDHITSVNETLEGAVLSIKLGGQDIKITSSLSGIHNMQNILAALVIADHFGLSKGQMKEGVSSYLPDNMRSQVIGTERNQVLLDAYNANPSSMKAAINSVLEKEDQPLFILGDMLELGHKSDSFHQEVIQMLIDLKVKDVILVGETFTKVAKEISYMSYEAVQDLIEADILGDISNRTIVVKASRGVKLEKVMTFL